MDCYVLSHNGLGDNILMNGALNYLAKFYNNVYFLCKDINIHHVSCMYKNSNIIPIMFDSKNEYHSCHELLSDKYKTSDVLIAGCHKAYLKTQTTIVTTNELSSLKIPSHFKFGGDFYKDIGLNPSIMGSHFNLNCLVDFTNIYNAISNYKIIFLHTESSQSTIDLNYVIQQHILKTDYLIISANNNAYDKHHCKYELANKYIKLPTIIHYVEIIKNAEELHMIDSSISCLALCLKLNEKTTCIQMKIYDRFTSYPIDLSL